MKNVSIVIPLYNEEEVVEELMRRLKNSLKGLNYNFEFILIDDGSADKTIEKLLICKNSEPRLKVIKLSKNWGHQNSYNAGLDHAVGDGVIMMDGDLEDPPELIPTFLEKWEEGYDVVYGVKQSRQRSTLDKVLFWLFYKLLKFFANIRVDEHAGMFSLIDSKVVERLRACSEKNKFYVGLRALVGCNQVAVPFHREKRYAGSPKQTFKRLVNYALNAYFSFSFIPIRILTYFGLFLIFSNIMFCTFLIIGKVTDIPLGYFELLRNFPGYYTSTVILIMFVMGVQIIFTGVIGEYVARIFEEVRNRPHYIVEKVFEADKKLEL